MYHLSDANHGKHIAGTYYEMAMGNFIHTLSHMLVRAGIKVNKLEDNYSIEREIMNLTAPEAYDAQRAALSRLLYRHFPFFGPIMADHTDHILSSKRKKVQSASDDGNLDLGQELKDEVAGASACQMIRYLATIAGALVYYRNMYSHKNHYDNAQDIAAQQEREQKLALWLDVVFRGARDILLTRKSHPQPVTDFLTQNGTINYYIEKNGKSAYNPNFYFKPGLKTDNGWVMTDFGKFFFCSLFLRRADAERFAAETDLYVGSPFKITAQERARLQEAENKRAADEQARASSAGFPHIVNPRTIGPSESPQNNIIREMLNMHRARIPRERRIDADMSEGILAMDIMNELRRCPLSLYNTLSPEAKASFEKMGVTPEGGIVSNLLVRHSDRYPELALRAIDQMELLPTIRFHVRLGSLRFRFYEKKLIDGSHTLRTVQKAVNGFGRWQEVEPRRVEKYTAIQARCQNDKGIDQFLPDSPTTTPYITDWRTTYNIHANRIGLAWNLPQMSDGIYLPNLDTDKGDNLHRKALIDMPAPMCYLSIFDLPALLFYCHIYTHYHGTKYHLPSAESIIQAKYDALHKFFSFAAAQNHSAEQLREKQLELNLADNEIPDKLRCMMQTKPFFKNGRQQLSPLGYPIMKNWIGVAEQRKHAAQVLRDVANEAADRLASFEKKHQRVVVGGRDNRYGRRGHADIRHGSLARYLATSMVRWQPALDQPGGDKLTSANHRALADFLSEYGLHESNINKLRNVLKEAGLIEGSHPHPFLAHVLESAPANIEALYVAYLKHEQSHATALKNKFTDRNGIVQPSEVPAFVRFNSSRWRNDSATTARRYLQTPPAPGSSDSAEHNAPIMLPDGLFTTHIMTLLNKVLGQNDRVPEEDYLRHDLPRIASFINPNGKTYGAAYIIRAWFDQVENQDVQPFYDLPRFYREISLLAPRRKPNQELIRVYFSEEQIAQKIQTVPKKQRSEKVGHTIDTEKDIRRYRLQDITLYLTLLDMLTLMLSRNEAERTDRQMKSSTAERVSNMRLVDFDLLGSTSGEAAYSYRHQRSGITISMPALSLRSYGSIFRVLADSRFETLMDALNRQGVTHVNFGDITSELALYDTLRSHFLLQAHNVEQDAFSAKRGVLENHTSPFFYRSGNLQLDDQGNITNPSTDAIRNHYGELIKILDRYSLKIDKKTKDGKSQDILLRDLMAELRNAAAHNRYPKADFFFRQFDHFLNTCKPTDSNLTAPNYIRTVLEFLKSIVDNNFTPLLHEESPENESKNATAGHNVAPTRLCP